MADSTDVWQAYAMDGAEALRAIEESLLILEEDPANQAEVNRLYRGLHTLKGNSGFLRLSSIEQLAHRSEDLIGLVRDAAVPLDAEIVEMMLSVVDRLRELVEFAGQQHRDADESRVTDLVGRVSALQDQRRGGAPPPSPAVKPAEAVLFDDPPAPEPAPEPEPPPPVPVATESVAAPVVVRDPLEDPEYLEIFLELARTSLGEIGGAVVDAQLGDAGAATRLRSAAEELALAAERMGLVHVVTAVNDLVAATAAGSAGLANVSDQELALCSVLADVEEHYRRIAPEPKECGVRALFQRCCANAVLADLASMRTMLDGLVGLCEAEVVAVFRRLRAACDYYGFRHASVRCLDESDRLARVIAAGETMDPAILRQTTTFVERLGASIHAVNAGSKATDVDIEENADDPMRFAPELAELPVSDALQRQLTRTALRQLGELRGAGQTILEIAADLDRSPTLAEAFTNWLGGSGATFVSSAVVDGPVPSYRFLLGFAGSLSAARASLASLGAGDHLFVHALEAGGKTLDQARPAPAKPAAAPAAPPTRAARAPTTASAAAAANAPPQAVAQDPQQPSAPPAPQEPAAEAATAPAAGRGEDEEGGDVRGGDRRSEFLRIDARKVSLIMDLAGELGLSCGAVTHHPDIDRQKLENFAAAAHKLEMLVRELQNEVSGLRLVPVSGVFQRMRRVVRDAAKRTGKPAELVLVGEDTEIDKVMVDALQDPLVHLLRNSVDHGLESPERRQEAGKPAKGRIVLEASHQGREVSIEVSDDGGGLDRPRILARAKERGLVPADAVLDDASIDQLIFLPGFSTKETVDELSGRGVGMDVVKTSVEGLRGTVKVQSTAGRGSRITLTMPLTLAFIEAMVVSESERLFAVPIEKVLEVFQAQPQQVRASAATGQTLLRVRDSLVPVLWLHQFYDGSTNRTQADLRGRVVVIVQARRGPVALPVDALLGNQQVMLKPMRGFLGKVRAAAGCGMLRSGDVAVALDCEKLND